MIETDLGDHERDVLNWLQDQFAELQGLKVQSRSVRPGERQPDNVTPAKVRGLIRAAVAHLPRAEELEAFVIRRLTLNGLSFEAWENSPERILETQTGGKADG